MTLPADSRLTEEELATVRGVLQPVLDRETSELRSSALAKIERWHSEREPPEVAEAVESLLNPAAAIGESHGDAVQRCDVSRRVIAEHYLTIRRAAK